MEFNPNAKALVCGASGGIGKAVAELLAESGVQVCLTARTESKLKEVCEGLKGDGHSFFACDFSDAKSVEGLCDFLKETGPYQIFINNSGGPKGGPVLNADPKAFLEAMQAHILSAQEVLNALRPQMQESGYGRLVNIISTSVKIPIPNLGVSNTIRGAVASWSKTLSLELGAENITVNNVLPGYTKTDRLKNLVQATSERLSTSTEEVEKLWKAKVPMARFGEVKEVAQAVCFLASVEASYISGVSLAVDGGRTGAL